MGGRFRGFEAAALVNCNVDHDTTGFHRLYHIRRHQLWRVGAGDQNSADHKISFCNRLTEGCAGGKERPSLCAKVVINPLKGEQVTVKDCNIGLQANSHLGGIEANHAPTDDHNVRRRDARNTADQYARTVGGLLQVVRPGENRHAASNFRHRLEQRQSTTSGRHCFVCNTGRTGFDQVFSLLGIWGEGQIGIEQVMRA